MAPPECTPAEAASIIIHGYDKWRTIMGNAWLPGQGRRAIVDRVVGRVVGRTGDMSRWGLFRWI